MAGMSYSPTLSGDWERLRVISAGISALVLTVGIARFAYTPLLPIMRDEAGMSALTGGWLATVNYGGYILGALIASSIPALWVKYQLYRVGLLLALVSTIAMGWTTDPVLWGGLRFLSGVSSTTGLLLASGIVLNWLARNGRKPELGLHFTGIGLGVMLSGIAVEAMVGRWPWDGQWEALGVLGLLFFVPAWIWMPAPPRDGGAGSGKGDGGPPDRTWVGLFFATYLCAGFGYVISATFIVAILARLPELTGLGNWIWVVVGLAAAPSSFLWDRVAGALGPLWALVLAYGIQIVSILLSALFQGVVPNLLGAVLFGGTFVGIVGLALTVVGRRFPANPAKAMARLTIGYGVAQIVAPAFAGYIAVATGSYRDALFLAAGMMVLGTVILLAMIGRESRRG
jgi:predicted MFS family arabinose efflux permease